VNVVTPLVSVITSISYDHMDVLGDTLTKIAGEKAGIIKPGVPVVSAPQDPEAMAVIEATCRERAAPLYLAEAAESLPPTEELSAARRYRAAQQFKLAGLPGVFETPLLGEHQLVNTAVAARALELQAKNERGLKLGPEQIRQGLRQVSWPGRLEVVENKPGQALLVVDGAHNAESARRLAQALNRENFYYEEIVFVVGVFQDKDVEGIFRELRESHLPVKAFILTKSESPRALAVADLKRRAGFEGDNTARVVLAEDVKAALKTARELSGPLDLICATGSLSITAEVQKAVLSFKF
jgi:dihydrofolate synthase/folylpolyglutamate synthase